MELQTGLWQQQTLRLTLTPKLQQSLQILQFSSLDLLSYLEAQCEQNPVLEWEAADWRRYLDFLKGGSPVSRQRPIHSTDDEDRNEGNRFQASGETLSDSLALQIETMRLSSIVKRAARYLIGCLDANGYLTIGLDQVQEALQISAETANEALCVIHSCEPKGIGARNLQECLLLQAYEKFHQDSLVIALIEHHLEDVAKGKWTKLAKVCNTTVLEIQKAADRLRTLEPKPGRNGANEFPVFILPDVVVRREAGDWLVTAFSPASPRLRINSSYELLLKQASLADDSRQFLMDHFRRAVWVVKSVEQRQSTMIRVMQALVELQPEYFEKGPRFIRPLTLKQVSDRVNLHESTVFRTTTGKYAQTPWGLIEMKSLFSSGVETDSGQGISARSVQAEMKQLLEREDPEHPLSDQKITELLLAKGFAISRRTVTKYRELMGIGSSSQRQRFS